LGTNRKLLLRLIIARHCLRSGHGLPTIVSGRSRSVFEKIEGFSNMPRGGKRPGSGRKKGSTNKLTSDVRQAIMEAFSILGGAEYLRKVATEMLWGERR
jgi:hypothetical protein